MYLANSSLSYTYQSLHHQYSLFPQSCDKLMYIDWLLSLDSLQHVVQSDKCSRPAHTSTTVDHHEVCVADDNLMISLLDTSRCSVWLNKQVLTRQVIELTRSFPSFR